MKELTGKTAVITGAASGIGLALTERCISEGMRVVMADIEAPKLTLEAARLREAGADVLDVVVDVADDVQVEALKLAKRPVAIMLDGDAWEESWILAARLRFEGCRAGFVKLPPRTDPDEVPLDWARNEARRCINAPL